MRIWKKGEKMTKHGRLIDADALKEKAWDADTRCGYVQVVDVGDIDDAPTIEPERETGEWIDYIGKDLGIEGQWLRDDGKTVFIQCNKCDSLYVRNFMIHPNFCPNCGARMSGGERQCN